MFLTVATHFFFTFTYVWKGERDAWPVDRRVLDSHMLVFAGSHDAYCVIDVFLYLLFLLFKSHPRNSLESADSMWWLHVKLYAQGYYLYLTLSSVHSPSPPTLAGSETNTNTFYSCDPQTWTFENTTWCVLWFPWGPQANTKVYVCV